MWQHRGRAGGWCQREWGASINHPTDLRRRRVKRGGERRGAGLFLRGGGVVHAGYKVVPSSPPPQPWSECHEFSRLVALVRKMANKRASPPPTFASLLSGPLS